jgi:hypothetical protein
MKNIFDFDENDGQSFLNEKPARTSNNLFKADFTKLKTGKTAYKAKLRFLPNILREPIETPEGTKIKGEDLIEKIRHYVDIKTFTAWCGYYDSPINFGKTENCPLSKLYFDVTKSKTPNANAIERVESIKYQRKYYSYVLVIEDEQQPELVGKIMILEYGIDIYKKLQLEKTGEKTGEKTNVFSMTAGKDFIFYVTQKKTNDGRTYPDYAECEFDGKVTVMPIFANGEIKRLPLEDGKIPAKLSAKVRDFFFTREKELSDFAPKRLTEEQFARISEITSWVLGKATMPSNNNPSKDDFSTDIASQPATPNDDFFQAPASVSATSSDDDDFFN